MALTFDGTSSKLEYIAGAAIISAFPVSIFAWIKPTSAALTKAGYVGGMGDGSSVSGLEPILAGNDTNDPFYGSSRASSTAVYDAAVPSAASAGVWTPCLVVYTSSTLRKAYFGAGTPDEGTTNNAPTIANMWRINVGVRPSTGNTVYFDGDIAEFAIWSSALSDANWTTLSGGAVPSGVDSGSLLDYWSLTTQASTHTGVNGIVLTATSTSQASDHPSIGGGSAIAALANHYNRLRRG